MLSKLDSRVIDEVVVIKGPYSSLYGPGLSFIDVSMKPSPRSDKGFDSGGSSSLEYKTNGEQWYGRQGFWAAGTDSGAAVSYGHRTGNDYTIGGGSETLPSSHEARDFNVAVGVDLDEHQSVEFNYIRLDQSGVELAGQIFDIDVLETDGFDVSYESLGSEFYDRAFVETWYNQTRFRGLSNSVKANRFTPLFNRAATAATTRVNSSSAGYRSGFQWDGADASLILGTDLRSEKQSLDELVTARRDTSIVSFSPIPKSAQVNPGLFLEITSGDDSATSWTGGVRVDWVDTNLLDSGATAVGTSDQPQSLSTLLLPPDGGELDPDYLLWSAYATMETDLGCGVAGFVSTGFGQRPPTLTELYSAETFLFLVQSGLTALRGNPGLKPSRAWQIDFGLNTEQPAYRGSATGFFSLIQDYITFDSEEIFVREMDLPDPVFGDPGNGNRLEFQNVLRSRNTDLAAIGGVELDGEFDIKPWLTGFGTLSCTHGTDLRRNGENRSLTTSIVSDSSSITPNDLTNLLNRPVNPAPLLANLGGLIAANPVGETATSVEHEPLPAISPLDTRLGLRCHEPSPDPRYSIELSTRVVAAQGACCSFAVRNADIGIHNVGFESVLAANGVAAARRRCRESDRQELPRTSRLPRFPGRDGSPPSWTEFLLVCRTAVLTLTILGGHWQCLLTRSSYPY